MKHLIKKENNILHGTIGWSHKGNDGQYCEAGETVRIKWQPTAGWGLKEVHYTDGDGNVVAIEGGEFVMPDSAVVIGATFKRFFLSDWADNPYNPHPQPAGPKCLTFTAGAGGASLAFFFNRSSASEEQQNPNIIFQKSTDGGVTWVDHIIGVYDPGEGDTSNLDVITLDEGESAMFKGVNSENFTVGDPENEEGIYVGFYLNGSAAASGDITSLINGVGGDATVQFMQFYYMFNGCTGLTTAPSLPATTLAEYCYNGMFNGCTGLTTAPSLPATTLAEYCYNGMFSGCTGMTTAPSLPATTLAEYCYDSMFYGCMGITSHEVVTLNNSQNTFQSNSSCASLTIHAETPPTIASSTITGLKADCIIYVPAASVDAYKAAQYWSARASYIQAIQ